MSVFFCRQEEEFRIRKFELCDWQKEYYLIDKTLKSVNFEFKNLDEKSIYIRRKSFGEKFFIQVGNHTDFYLKENEFSFVEGRLKVYYTNTIGFNVLISEISKNFDKRIFKNKKLKAIYIGDI